MFFYGPNYPICATSHLRLCARLSRYSDDQFEYRHVQLPKAMLKVIPKEYHDTSKGTLKLLHEDEWRALGITQVSNKPSLPQIVAPYFAADRKTSPFVFAPRRIEN